MPKCCSECILNYDCCACILTGSKWYNNPEVSDFDSDIERLPDCPLVEIPQNVRLIDANALLKEFDYGKDVNWGDLNESLVHKTGIWAEIQCAPAIFEEGE